MYFVFFSSRTEAEILCIKAKGELDIRSLLYYEMLNLFQTNLISSFSQVVEQVSVCEVFHHKKQGLNRCTTA